MADLTTELYEAHPRRTLGDAALYYSIFSVLFIFSFIVFSVLRVFGHRVTGGVLKAAKRAAHGPAGYAVNMQ